MALSAPDGKSRGLEFGLMIELNRQSKTPIGDQLVNGLARLVKERSLLYLARGCRPCVNSQSD